MLDTLAQASTYKKTVFNQKVCKKNFSSTLVVILT